MPSPFPGMDPFLEIQEWEDFHVPPDSNMISSGFRSSIRRRIGLILLILLCIAASKSACGQDQPLQRAGTTIAFATVDQGVQRLTTEDDFLRRLSPFDFQVRTRSPTADSVADFRDLVSKNVLEWPTADRQRVIAAIDSIAAKLEEYSPQSPAQIYFIKTTGIEESNAAYTRGNAIVLTADQLQMPLPKLARLIAHEWFHVMTRGEPELRDRLYKIIGFEKTNEIHLPENLVDLKITNPDAPIIQHVMRLRMDDQRQVFVSPMLYAKQAFDPAFATSLFAYLNFELVEVEANDEGDCVCVLKAGSLVTHPVEHPDFVRQIGRNTRYIIHPEEILADNFSDLVTGRTDAPDPWLPEKMRDVLSDP